MPRLTFAGPTNILEILSQLLEKLQQIEESHQKNQIPVYSILFILTDGIVRDMKKTIDLLIRSTSFPVSIVIIGIGDHDFINMRLLEDSEVYYDYLQDEMDVRNSMQQQTEHDDEMDSRPLSNQQSLPDLPVYHRNNVQFLS
jgi:adenylate cyclase